MKINFSVLKTRGCQIRLLRAVNHLKERTELVFEMFVAIEREFALLVLAAYIASGYQLRRTGLSLIFP